MTTQLAAVAAEDAAACGHKTGLGHRWWVLCDRTYNALRPLRMFVFRRYYQLGELRGEVMELQRDLELALEISAEHTCTRRSGSWRSSQRSPRWTTRPRGSSRASAGAPGGCRVGHKP